MELLQSCTKPTQYLFHYNDLAAASYASVINSLKSYLIGFIFVDIVFKYSLIIEISSMFPEYPFSEFLEM